MYNHNIPLYPLTFDPIIKRLIWGGRRLGEFLNKPLGSGQDYAESWEVSDHGGDVSRVADGPFAGELLRDLVQRRSAELFGPALGSLAQFPLLVKFLDAHQVLSVQVHPDDDLGRRLVNDNGKTEAWVIVHSEPDSLIYAGLRPGTTKQAFAAALETGEVEPLLHRFHPDPGDCIMIPAGTVHAIGAGVVLAEIQQTSDATFRVHDWGRVGPDGKPRALHLAEALESINFDAEPVDPLPVEPERFSGGTRERLADCDYFALDRLKIDCETEIGSHDRFTIVLALEGAAIIRHEGSSYPLAFGQTRLLPAVIGRCRIKPWNSKSATVLRCVVP